MTQDTRKDPRAKIVSLNVRYKSATVDEFIENHSYDVSKGGIYIKTPSPFPPGTLLKFEIRIAGDKAVISGVGRVVWKREAAQSTTERPSGMGVKFIKLDDASRVVIDKLVDAKGADAGIAFEAGNTEAGTIKAPGVGAMAEIVKPAAGSPFEPAPSTKLQAAPAAAAPPEQEPAKAEHAPMPAKRQAHTVIGIGAPVLAKPAAAAPAAPAPAPFPAPVAPAASTPAKSVVPAPAPTPKPATPAPAASVVPQRPAAPAVPRKPAYDPPPRPAAGAPASPKPAAGEPAAVKPAAAASSMFPKTDSLKEMPPTGEQTVMKQAAELLEEALRGAGGSMDEIGSNPLFDVAMKQSPSANGSASAPPPELEPPPVAKMAELDEPVKATEEAPTPASLAPPTPLPGTVAAEEPTPTPPPKREPPKESVRPKPIAESPREVARAMAAPEPPAKGGGGKAIFGLVAVVAVAGIGYYAYTQLAEPSTTPPTSSSTSVTPPPPSAAAQPTTEPSAATVTPSAAPASSAAAPPTSAAAPTTSASTAPASSAPASASAPSAAPKPPPPVTAAPPAPAPPTPAPKPVPKPAPAPVNQGSQASDNPSPPPAPKPKPKKPADDDNPY